LNKLKMIKYAELVALKGLLRERKTPYKKIATIIGITAHAFSDKINGHNSFDVLELDKIANYLNINTSDIRKYFFP
jgi:DNA-binding Xre family transcriptional regulator